MANELRDSLPKPEPFNWEREYGPLWDGDKCTAFWLAPGPDDVLMIDGIRDTLCNHTAGKAKPQWRCACGETDPHYMLNCTTCYACDAGYIPSRTRARVRMKIWDYRAEQTRQRINHITGMNAAQAQNYYGQQLGVGGLLNGLLGKGTRQ